MMDLPSEGSRCTLTTSIRVYIEQSAGDRDILFLGECIASLLYPEALGSKKSTSKRSSCSLRKRPTLTSFMGALVTLSEATAASYQHDQAFTNRSSSQMNCRKISSLSKLRAGSRVQTNPELEDR